MYLWIAPPSSIWVIMMPWGERLEPRPPVICMPRPSWPFTICIFQMLLPSLTYKRAQISTNQTLHHTGLRNKCNNIHTQSNRKTIATRDHICLDKMWHERKLWLRTQIWKLQGSKSDLWGFGMCMYSFRGRSCCTLCIHSSGIITMLKC